MAGEFLKDGFQTVLFAYQFKHFQVMTQRQL
jgi:hypothetical protein